MADLRLVSFNGVLLVELGWFEPGSNPNINRVVATLQPELQERFRHEAKARFEKELSDYRNQQACWEALIAAGVAVPTIVNPNSKLAPQADDYTKDVPRVEVERVRFGGYGENWQPTGKPAWLVARRSGDQIRCGHAVTWHYDEAAAMEGSLDANLAGQAHYKQAVWWREDLAQLALAEQRDWQIITGAGLVPMFEPRPVPDELPGYDEWQAEKLRSAAAPLFEPIELPPATNATWVAYLDSVK